MRMKTDADRRRLLQGGKDGRVFLSKDAGAHWTKVAEGTGSDPLALPNSNGSLSSIAFDPQDPNTVYVASVKPNAALNHLWKSTDFGAHWAAIDGNGLPAGVPVNIIKPDPVPEPGTTVIDSCCWPPCMVPLC